MLDECHFAFQKMIDNKCEEGQERGTTLRFIGDKSGALLMREGKLVLLFSFRESEHTQGTPVLARSF